MLLFKDIQPNYPIYILDKQSMTFTQGKAVQVGFSHMEMNTSTGKMEMMKDITIDAGGKTANYAIPDVLSVSYAGNIVFSTDRQGIVNEVRALCNSAEQYLAQVEQQKEMLQKSKQLLTELDSDYKEKQQTEERFAKMESSISEIKDMLNNLLNPQKK